MTATLCLRIATDARDRDRVFAARYRVYVDQEKALGPRADQRLLDAFDESPATTHFAVWADTTVIAGIRYTAPSAAGTSALRYHDFAVLGAGTHEAGCGSTVFVDRDYRDWGLGSLLVKLAGWWARSRGDQMLIGVVNPTAHAVFARLGYQTVGEERVGADGRPFLPVALPLPPWPQHAIGSERWRGLISRSPTLMAEGRQVAFGVGLYALLLGELSLASRDRACSTGAIFSVPSEERVAVHTSSLVRAIGLKGALVA